MSEIYKSTDVLFYTAENVAKERLGLNKGDKIVITGGTTDGITGNTNLIKIETI
jgi:pyruvate kinase